MLIRNLGYHSSFTGGTRFVLIPLPNELLEKAKPSNIDIPFLEAVISFNSDNAIVTYNYTCVLIARSIFVDRCLQVSADFCARGYLTAKERGTEKGRRGWEEGDPGSGTWVATCYSPQENQLDAPIAAYICPRYSAPPTPPTPPHSQSLFHLLPPPCFPAPISPSLSSWGCTEWSTSWFLRGSVL